MVYELENTNLKSLAPHTGLDGGVYAIAGSMLEALVWDGVGNLYMF